MDLHNKMTIIINSTVTSPVTKTAKTSKWLRLYSIKPPFFCSTPFLKPDFLNQIS